MSEKKKNVSDSSSDDGDFNSTGKDVEVFDDVEEENMSCSQMWAKYPKHVSFIVGNEFCERFSYYGMRSVLLLYLRNYLHWDDDTSTSVYHAFTVLAYLFPLVGAIIADSYWGKYKTIIYLSIVYIFGHVVKTIGSIPYVPSQTAHAILSMFGLFFIAVGTGGIKPCVSSFGGDQFSVDQKYVRKQFFSLFYFAINAGSLISTFVTPIFRADVDCYPEQDGPEFDECYALAFGVPAALMVVALIFFVAGSRWYTIYPPEGSIFVRVCRCIGSACKNRWNTPNSERNKDHWLEYANATPKLIRDTKYVLRVLVLYIPLPFFWALFDQQGSRWTLQAIQTNGYLGTLLIKPDQVEVLNPLLIVTLIPLFEATLYPTLRYFKIPFPPLRRMTVGLILAGISFIAAAILQIEIDKARIFELWNKVFSKVILQGHYNIILNVVAFIVGSVPSIISCKYKKTVTPLPRSNEYGIRFINTAECNITLTPASYDAMILPPNFASEILFYRQGEPLEFSYIDCKGGPTTEHIARSPAKQEVVDAIIRSNGIINEVHMITEKTEDGGGRFSLVNLDTAGRTLWIDAVHVESGEKPERPTEVAYGYRSDAIDLPYGNALVNLYNNESFSEETLVAENLMIYMDVGGAYSIWFQDKDNTFNTDDLNPNVISVAWMIPQFVIITVGEVFLSITGLEFSYTQAPPSMKSVLTSIWLFTVSLGNIIVIIIAEAKGIEKQSDEFFLFAGLIFAAALIFIFLAYRYIPVDENEFTQELADDEKRLRQKNEEHRRKSLDGHDNHALEEAKPPLYEVIDSKESAPGWETQTAL